jgi:uncharacterized SAM-binding protein YcdF (DUF218 family)
VRIFRIVGANLILLAFVWLIWGTFEILFSVIGVIAIFFFVNTVIDKKFRDSMSDIFSDSEKES